MRGGHPWHRRCLFGRHGSLAVSVVCGYEVAALAPRSPLPPITHLVRRWPPLGWAILAALGHHFFVELAEAVATD